MLIINKDQNGKQCWSIMRQLIMNRLIWIYIVCKRICVGLVGQKGKGKDGYDVTADAFAYITKNRR